MDANELSQNAHCHSLFETTGTHLLGTGIGAMVSGAAAGTVGAVLGGPIGVVAGVTIGALIGGLAGKAAEEYVDPAAEEAYWRSHFEQRPYVREGTPYETLAEAYRFGWESCSTYRDFDFHEVEKDLAATWAAHHGQNAMSWDEVRPAVLDAWRRVDRAHDPDLSCKAA